jgi:hypothetical protein
LLVIVQPPEREILVLQQGWGVVNLLLAEVVVVLWLDCVQEWPVPD